MKTKTTWLLIACALLCGCESKVIENGSVTKVTNGVGSACDIHIIEKGGYKFAVAVGGNGNVSIVQIIDR